MNILTIADRFPNEQSCVETLERVKWQGVPRCPFYVSEDVERKHENETVGRWNRCNHQSPHPVQEYRRINGLILALRTLLN